MIISALAVETQILTDTTASTVPETVMIITTIVALSKVTSEAALRGVVASGGAGAAEDGTIENDSHHETETKTGIPREVDAVGHVVPLVGTDQVLTAAKRGSARQGDRSPHTCLICNPTHRLLVHVWPRSTMARTNLGETSGRRHPQKTHRRRQYTTYHSRIRRRTMEERQHRQTRTPRNHQNIHPTQTSHQQPRQRYLSHRLPLLSPPSQARMAHRT